jgi:hypothetical protein
MAKAPNHSMTCKPPDSGFSRDQAGDRSEMVWLESMLEAENEPNARGDTMGLLSKRLANKTVWRIKLPEERHAVGPREAIHTKHRDLGLCARISGSIEYPD